MRKLNHAILAGLVALLAGAPAALGQVRPYIGFVYPAGGQQGTKFIVTLGGQNIDGIDVASVSGTGVTARVLEYRRRLGPQEIQVLNEQLRRLKKAPKGSSEMMMMQPAGGGAANPANMSIDAQQLAAKVQKRISDYVLRPHSNAIANLATVEITIASDAPPGRREITIATPRGVSNALVFYVGQFPEVNRKPMSTAHLQVLGKEELALRKRPDDEIEQSIILPCTLNGQVASGEVNYYRFKARKGQKLVISCEARNLIPFLADAVPGWFQPTMALYDGRGKEVAYNDDFRFKPDPVIFYQVPQDGEYLLSMTDALYRGREDFVYRITIGEVPFITGIFPLGSRADAPVSPQLQGWNLDGCELVLPGPSASPGTYAIAAKRKGIFSNYVPFKIETLPELLEQEPNNDAAKAQKVTLPVVINGRINKSDDWDVFAFTGKAGQTIVAEVDARRLESPLDSFLKITDSSGKVIAFNDDLEDPEAGANTQDADSYIVVKLPADGTYYVHLGDSARQGGDDYTYRLRISEPQPDFALRIVPSSIGIRARSSNALTIQVVRKDGFNAPIQISLKDPPAGFSASAITVAPNQSSARLNLRADTANIKPVPIIVQGQANLPGRPTITHVAVPVEDRMQAFLWRHYVPAQECRALAFDPSVEPQPRRIPRPVQVKPPEPNAKQKFTKAQVAGRIRQIKLMFEEGLLTDEFYAELMAECEAAKN